MFSEDDQHRSFDIPVCNQSYTASSPVQVRTVSAKALGAMVKGMGESCFDDLLPWLMETLASEQSSVDRSGAAQGQSSSCRFFGFGLMGHLSGGLTAILSQVLLR